MPRHTRARHRAVATAVAAGLLGTLSLTACSATDVTPDAAAAERGRPATTAPAKAKPTQEPPSPAVLAHLAAASVNIADGREVGVGMPISVTFKHPIPKAERVEVERLLKVTADPGVTGGWAWIKDRNLHDGQRVDFRPRTYWKPGTKVSLQAGPDISRTVTIARSLVATVDVRTHRMTVVKDGADTRTIPITAGAAGMETWNGTMVVSDKQRSVVMDSRTVGYGDSYYGRYNYAVHLTTSGTYLHENPKANTYAGNSNVTHGCVGLATDGTARGFYEQIIPGDVIRVTGSKDQVAVGNGYGDWNLPWSEWLALSAL
ncbi:L,D-transpeptidase [Streptomyces sp. NBC_01304]|uniref:L,D-transpeptidase n=1 Tax=Streptomyces sp. NBC_01304 TaxID=2903818 RepID=UPI002E15EA43|nr:L,D-transpeptidase [Streptomyces sp. NBC_01304]